MEIIWSSAACVVVVIVVCFLGNRVSHLKQAKALWVELSDESQWLPFDFVYGDGPTPKDKFNPVHKWDLLVYHLNYGGDRKKNNHKAYRQGRYIGISVEQLKELDRNVHWWKAMAVLESIRRETDFIEDFSNLFKIIERARCSLTDLNTNANELMTLINDKAMVCFPSLQRAYSSLEALGVDMAEVEDTHGYAEWVGVIERLRELEQKA